MCIDEYDAVRYNIILARAAIDIFMYLYTIYTNILYHIEQYILLYLYKTNAGLMTARSAQRERANKIKQNPSKHIYVYVSNERTCACRQQQASASIVCAPCAQSYHAT